MLFLVINLLLIRTSTTISRHSSRTLSSFISMSFVAISSQSWVLPGNQIVERRREEALRRKLVILIIKLTSTTTSRQDCHWKPNFSHRNSEKHHFCEKCRFPTHATVNDTALAKIRLFRKKHSNSTCALSNRHPIGE